MQHQKVVHDGTKTSLAKNALSHYHAVKTWLSTKRLSTTGSKTLHAKIALTQPLKNSNCYTTKKPSKTSIVKDALTHLLTNGTW